MMNNELVSVIIPVYNGEKYIAKCIESLLNQTYKDIEIIIINDGSTDATSMIVNNLIDKDKRINQIITNNLGVSSARNCGIKVAKGKYITFVDSDDTVQNNYIEYLYLIIKKENCDIALTRYPNKIVDENKYEIDTSDDKVRFVKGSYAAKEMLSYKIVISSWNKMFKKDLLIDHSIVFNTDLSYGEGFEFVIKAFFNANKVAIGSKKIYNYRVDNENSVMTSYKEKLVTGSFESLQSILNSIKNLQNDEEKQILINSWKYANWHTYCDCFNTIIGCNVKSKNKALYKKIKSACRRYAFSGLKLKLLYKDYIKMILYFISPYFTAIFINGVRKRKFKKEH